MSETRYRNHLTRTLHPVFQKDYSGVVGPDSSFHHIRNAIVARQLVTLKAKIDELELNSFPHTVLLSGINDWENDYFGFTKPSKSLGQRIIELLAWVNNEIGMTLPDVVKVSKAITGEEPLVIYRISKGSFILGKARLGVTTILGGGDTTANRYTYLVKFSTIINSTLLAKLDSELTRIEKAGSKHILSSPKVKWILGSSALGRDTYLRI